MSDFEKSYKWDPLSASTLSLSILTTSFVLFVSLRFKLYKDGLGKLAFLNLFSSLLYCFFKLMVLIPQSKTEMICRLSLGIMAIGRTCTQICIALIGHALLLLMKTQDPTRIKNLEKAYTFLAFVPAILVEIPKMVFSTCAVTNDSVCSIFIPADRRILRFGTMVLPTTILTGLSLIFYIATCIKMCQKGIWQKEMMTLFLFPTIAIACWVPARIFDFLFILRIIATANPSIENVIIQIGHLVGFFQAAFYAASRSVYDKIKHKLCCCYKKEEPTKERLSLQVLTSDEESLKRTLTKRKKKMSGFL